MEDNLKDNELEQIIAGKIGPSGVIAPNIGWPSKINAVRDWRTYGILKKEYKGVSK